MKDAARAPHHVAGSALANVEPAGMTDLDGDDGIAVLRGTAPAWQRDALAISARVRALLATLRPVVIRVLTFWDHAVRAIGIGGRRLEIDASGCYRLR